MPADKDPCVICKTIAEDIPTTFDGIHQRCPRCGEFKIAGTALAMLDSRRAFNSKLSAWVREQTELGEVPMITSKTFAAVEVLSPLSIRERADRLLRYLVKSAPTLNAQVSFAIPATVSITHSQSSDEVIYLALLLKDEGYLARITGNSETFIAPRGHMRHEELSARHTQSVQGFVAMWFHGDMTPAYELGFYPGIKAAGYIPRRVDSVEHAGKIDDEIIAQIRKSRFIVADYTGNRGGVYFEAGFASGLNLPVVWTCRADHMDALHFDIRQFNFIVWDTPADLAPRLTRRIEAVIGPGPEKPAFAAGPL